MSAKDKKRRKVLRPEEPDEADGQALVVSQQQSSVGKSSVSNKNDGRMPPGKILSQPVNGSAKRGTDTGGKYNPTASVENGDNGSKQSRPLDDDTRGTESDVSVHDGDGVGDKGSVKDNADADTQNHNDNSPDKDDSDKGGREDGDTRSAKDNGEDSSGGTDEDESSSSESSLEEESSTSNDPAKPDAQSAGTAEQNGSAAAGTQSVNPAGTANAVASTGNSVAEAGAAEVGVPVTPQDLKDFKEIGADGVKDDLKGAGKSLSEGNVTDAVDNQTVQKAADIAMRSGDPTAMAVGAAVKAAGAYAEHGGEIDAKHPMKVLSSDNAKALGETVKDVGKQAAGASSYTDDDGLDSGNNILDIGDEDPNDTHGASDEIDDGESDDKASDEDAKDENSSDEEDGSEQEQSFSETEEEDDNKQNASSDLAKTAAKGGLSASAHTAAVIAPKLIAVKAAYAFAQFLYMMFMQAVQLAAQAACWLVAMFQSALQAIGAFFMTVGHAMAAALGASVSAVQSFALGSGAAVVAVVLVVIGVAAFRYDVELQNMLASDAGIIFSTGCSEVEKNTWGKLKESFTNDPVPGLTDQQVVVIQQIMSVMQSGSLPANAGGIQDSAYIYGVLANAYAESGLDPTRVESDPLGITMSSIFENDMHTYKSGGKDKLKQQNEYVKVTRRANTYAYGIGLFQFTSYRNAFLEFCYDNPDALTKTSGYSDPLADSRSGITDADICDWYTVGAQLSYLLKYPVKVMFFTQPYDPTALKSDGIENVEGIDLSDISVGWHGGGLTDEEKKACYAATLFLGTFERPRKYLNGGDDRADVIARRCEMAVSICRKCKDAALLDSIDSTWAAGVVDRIVSGGGLATLDAISAGYTNCGMDTGAWDLTSPAAVAIGYSHPASEREDSICEREPTVAYKYIVSTLKDVVGDGMSDLGTHFGSCDRGVAYAYLVSGYDTTIPLGNVDTQYSYYQSSPRWEQIADITWDGRGSAGNYNADAYDTVAEREAFFQPGDVLVDYKPAGARTHVHTYMYLGNDMVLKVIGIEPADLSQDGYQVYANKETMQASYHEQYPHLCGWSIFRNSSSHQSGGGTKVFRCAAPEYNYVYRDLVRYGAPENTA